MLSKIWAPLANCSADGGGSGSGVDWAEAEKALSKTPAKTQATNFIPFSDLTEAVEASRTEAPPPSHGYCCVKANTQSEPPAGTAARRSSPENKS
jgi:hypothetical protein